MKQKLFQNLKFILIGVILAAGLTFAYAADGWANPGSAAPAGNLPVPLHAGPTQVKDGGLGVGTFAVNGDAQMAQDTYLNGIVRGDTPDQVNSTVSIGGKDTNGNNHVIPVTVSGGTSVVGAISNDAVINSTSSNLCAKADGTITLCNISGAPAAQNIIVTAGIDPTPIPPGKGPGGNVQPIVLKISQQVLTTVTGTVYATVDKTITGCNISTSTASPTLVATLHIAPFTTTGTEYQIFQLGNCPMPNVTLIVKNVSPTTSTTGQPIVGQ